MNASSADPDDAEGTPSGLRRGRLIIRLLAIVGAVALIGGVLERLLLSDREQIARQFTTFIEAGLDGDGDAACATLTPESRDELAATASLAGSDPTCESTIVAGLDQVENLEPATADLDELDAATVAEVVDVDGDEATLSEPGRIAGGLRARRIDGEWLLELEPAVSAPSELSADATPDEVIEAADQVCVLRTSEGSEATAELLAAAQAGDLVGLRSAAADLLAGEEGLLEDLETLADRSSSAELEALIVAQSGRVDALREVALRATLPRLRALAQATDLTVEVAESNGFSPIGCAIPTVQETAGGSR